VEPAQCPEQVVQGAAGPLSPWRCSDEERHVVIGPNGAGKTTLFNCIMGTIPLELGRGVFDGRNVGELPTHARPLGMSRTFQKTIFESLTVEENVHLAIEARNSSRSVSQAPLRHTDLAEESEELLEAGTCGGAGREGEELSTASSACWRSCSPASKPRMLLLDEPTMRDVPQRLPRPSGSYSELPCSLTLLVVEHDMEVVFAIARITVLHHGEVFLSARRKRYEETNGQEIYFGGGARRDA